MRRLRLHHRGSRYRESFNGKLRDKLLHGQILYTVKEAQIMMENFF